MSICQSCGGVIGRDCFNPAECMDITRAQAECYQSQGDVQGELSHLRERVKELETKTVPVDYKILTHLAVTGLKHIGSFRRIAGEDPHPLDCNLAGRVCQVFGVGLTRAIEIVRDAGENPHYREFHCGNCHLLVDASKLDDADWCEECRLNANH